MKINTRGLPSKPLSQRIHVDFTLLTILFLAAVFGSTILLSASNQDFSLIHRQWTRLGMACLIMIIFAQIPPKRYCTWSPWIYGLGLLLLFVVLLAGDIGKGAQRWLNLGFIRFQPAELMKLAVPMMLAWIIEKQGLPPGCKTLGLCCLVLLLPVLFIAKEPDLGTAILIFCSGFAVLWLSGLHWRWFFGLGLMIVATTPLAWHWMRPYQQQRILTFLDPERDPLRAGYHIIQSKIAIGSGGLLGKGWLNGTQSHLHFLPEHSTDFIFAVLCEEFGFIGAWLVIMLYVCIVARCLYISSQAQDTYSRLLTGSISLTFFISIFVNMGMVTGILPVVGLPLPLMSYGGTSLLTVMAGFGILMSVHTHRKLLTT